MGQGRRGVEKGKRERFGEINKEIQVNELAWGGKGMQVKGTGKRD